jgi:hypothetical protein
VVLQGARGSGGAAEEDPDQRVKEYEAEITLLVEEARMSCAPRKGFFVSRVVHLMLPPQHILISQRFVQSCGAAAKGDRRGALDAAKKAEKREKRMVMCLLGSALVGRVHCPDVATSSILPAVYFCR